MPSPLPQTGGACRAGNIYNTIIQSLKKAGYEQIPVISLNAFGEEKHAGFTITPKLLCCAIADPGRFFSSGSISK